MSPDWRCAWSMATKYGHMMLYTDESLGVEMLVETSRHSASGGTGKQRTSYAIKGVRKLFLTEDELIDELCRRSGGSILVADCCPNCGHDLTKP